jgi:ribosomal protein L3 glutamine methyltransferase
MSVPTEKTPALTVRDVLDGAVARLKRAGLSYGHGTTNERDEAVYLVLHALRLPLDRLTPVLERKLTAAERRRIERLVARRIAERLPAAYLTREAWLGEHRFYVDSRVIVPRSYIAELLRERLRPWVIHPSRVRRVLDLCTGSGCLAILAALAFPRARVDAADISSDALAVAHRNVIAYGLRARVRIVQSDLFAALSGVHYDIILSNPPYVTAPAMRALPAEYRHEPVLALAGGKDGLSVVKSIVAQAAAHLTADGLLVVETGHSRSRVERAYPRLPFIWPETSGGDDCVFLLEGRDLVRAVQPARRPRSATQRVSASRRD